MSTPLLTGCTDTVKGRPCKGRVSWEKVVPVFAAQGPDYWRGKCNKCSLTTRATTFEGGRLDERAGGEQ